MNDSLKSDALGQTKDFLGLDTNSADGGRDIQTVPTVMHDSKDAPRIMLGYACVYTIQCTYTIHTHTYAYIRSTFIK